MHIYYAPGGVQIFKMGLPGDKIFFLISTLYTDSENIYIDYKFNGPISAQHPKLLLYS
jgi:hypothetical protein